MGVEYSVSSDGGELKISVSGRFDFATKPALQEAYDAVDLKSAQVVINMAQAKYMDSSALGMLLVLREKAGGDSASIKLQDCQPAILELLKISKFEDLFEITDSSSEQVQ